jgi:hypothetical protein
LISRFIVSQLLSPEVEGCVTQRAALHFLEVLPEIMRFCHLANVIGASKQFTLRDDLKGKYCVTRRTLPVGCEND